VVEKLKDAYKIWQEILPHISKSQRQTIAAKIDEFLLNGLESTFRASYAPTPKRFDFVADAIIKIDSAKFFLLIGWENKIIDDKKYIRLSEKLVEASKMLAGWKAYLEKKTSAN